MMQSFYNHQQCFDLPIISSYTNSAQPWSQQSPHYRHIIQSLLKLLNDPKKINEPCVNASFITVGDSPLPYLGPISCVFDLLRAINIISYAYIFSCMCQVQHVKGNKTASSHSHDLGLEEVGSWIRLYCRNHIYTLSCNIDIDDKEHLIVWCEAFPTIKNVQTYQLSLHRPTRHKLGHNNPHFVGTLYDHYLSMWMTLRK